MRALIVLALGLAGGANAAAPLRLAIVYGHNGGTTVHAPLRFAEADALRVGATLVEVTGVKPEDLKVLQGRPRAELDAALKWATQRVAAAHRTPGAQAILTLYLSSHGDDGKGLELGPEKLSWAELKAGLAATKADVRLTFVDACNASGLIEVGARKTEPFQIEADDRLTVAGEAFITSSAADEPSLEAGAYRGSVFTHHLMAGLRGAGDRSGDGQVSLEELYRYAYARTVEGESGQHPGYGFKLAGRGELIVSSPKSAGATLMLTANLEAVTVSDVETGERFLEIRRPEGRLLALPPGRWQLEVWRGGAARVGRVTLAPGDKLTLDESAFASQTHSAELTRLAGHHRFCLETIGAEAALAQTARRLTEIFKHHPDQGCEDGASTVTVELSRERATGIRVIATVGARTFELHTVEATVEAELGRALTGN